MKSEMFPTQQRKVKVFFPVDPAGPRHWMSLEDQSIRLTKKRVETGRYMTLKVMKLNQRNLDYCFTFYSISLSVIQMLHDDKVDDDGHK